MDSDQPTQPPISPPRPPETGQPRAPTISGDASSKIDLNKPCRIADVSFRGAKRTKSTLLAKIVADIFPAKTLLDCLERAVKIRENLTTLDAFSKIELQIEPLAHDDDENFRITFVVQERGRVKASAQTAVDNHSSHLSLELGLPNLCGIGDSISLNSKFNKRFYSGECRYSVPISPWRKLWAPIYSLIYSQYEWDLQPSGYDQQDKAIINQVNFYSLPQLQHSISFENIWRFIKCSSISTPIEVREQCGHSIKSSLKHTVTWDDRLGGNFPSEGVLAKFSNEIATNLVTHGAKFTRHEANLQLNALILPEYDLLCQFNLLAGTLLKPQKINICDRFFAGGPLTLRGFKFQGLEPSIRGYPLGASSYLSAGIHLYSILPYTTPETPINSFIRPHIFLNTGTIGELADLWRINSRADIRRQAARFRDSLRYSCGLGLVLYFMNLRLEVNYCIPIVFRDQDTCSRGLQWGFGMTYT